MAANSIFIRVVLLALICLNGVGAAFAQSDTIFNRMNQKRESILNKGAIALGCISAGNVAATAAFLNQGDPAMQTIGKLNMVWNGGNVLIATFGYIRSRKALTQNLDDYESVSRARLVENMYCFSLGLDCSYIATSLRLMQEANTSSEYRDLRRGFAWFFMYQGLVYLTLDGTCLYSHYQNWKSSKHLLNRLKPAREGIGLMMEF